jgi:hypothetical protein
MNRLDKIVTFKPLGTGQLDQILETELKIVEQRKFNASPQRSFHFELTGAAKELLLSLGDRYEVRRTAAQTRYRAAAGPADLQFDRNSPGARRRLRADRLGAQAGALDFHQVADGTRCPGTIDAPVRAMTTGVAAAGRGILADAGRARTRLSRVI